MIDLTSHFPHQLIFLETKFKGTYYSHNFKITFAAKRSNLSGELPLDTKIATSERMTMVNHTNIKESILLKNKNRPARRKTFFFFFQNVVLYFQETRAMALPSSLLSFSGYGTIYTSSISFLVIVFFLCNQVGNSQASEGVGPNQLEIGLHNQG